MNRSIDLIFFALIALIVLSPLLTILFGQPRSWAHVLSVALLVQSLAVLGGLFYVVDNNWLLSARHAFW